MVGLKKLETTKNRNYILRDPIEEEEKQYTTTNTKIQQPPAPMDKKHLVRWKVRVRRTELILEK